jgi:hypothetical protein
MQKSNKVFTRNEEAKTLTIEQEYYCNNCQFTDEGYDLSVTIPDKNNSLLCFM